MKLHFPYYRIKRTMNQNCHVLKMPLLSTSFPPSLSPLPVIADESIFPHRRGEGERSAGVCKRALKLELSSAARGCTMWTRPRLKDETFFQATIRVRGVRALGCQSHHISAMLAIRSGFLVPYESPEYALSNEV